MMNKLFVAIAALFLGQAPLTADAAAISTDTYYSLGFEGVGSNIIGTASGGFTHCTNPSCVASPAGSSFEFTLASAGVLTILDLFISFDEFDIYNFGSLLGSTTASTRGGDCGSDFTCALADTRYSRGVFNLAAGSYSISGIQTAGTSGAGALIVETSPVPVPAAGVMLLSVLLGGGFAARRRRKNLA